MPDMPNDPSTPTYEEVISVFQQRFPREYEVAVLTVQNAKMRQAMQPEMKMAPLETDDE